MNASGVNHSLLARFANYSREKTKILEKLKNPRISKERKNRLQTRLNDLNDRLMPKTTRGLS